MKAVGQALWMIETGAPALLDNYAQIAIARTLRMIERDETQRECNPDILFGETIKAETLIGPPPVPEPYLTYVKWYSECLQSLKTQGLTVCWAGARITFGPPDIDACRRYVVDVYITSDDEKVVWIDVMREIPAGSPSTVLESLMNPRPNQRAKSRQGGR